MRRAKARLDTLDLYPRPVRVGRVRVGVAPWLSRMPWFRRFDGYATHVVIFVRARDPDDDLVTHELCHVWQMQHRPLAIPLPPVYRGYEPTPYEFEARQAGPAPRGVHSCR